MTFIRLKASFKRVVKILLRVIRVLYDRGAGNAHFWRSKMDARSIFALLEEEETLIFCTIGATLLSRRRRRKRDAQERTKMLQRRFWTRPWLLRRPKYGHYETLMAELGGEDLDGLAGGDDKAKEDLRRSLTSSARWRSYNIIKGYQSLQYS